MKNQETINFEGLTEKGLNLQGILNLSQLPESTLETIRTASERFSDFNQLVVIGHGGSTMWQKVCEDESLSEHPIDNFTIKHVTSFFSELLGSDNFEIIYPSGHRVGLQKLGEALGWHFASPFRIGINDEWGSWFAYRAVILTRSQFEVTPVADYTNPCLTCETQPCIKVCPPDALQDKDLSLQICLDYRAETDSKCGDRCIARLACPVAREHKYSLSQIQYHYSRSLKVIKRRNGG